MIYNKIQALFGGTFDPVHNGHVELVNMLQKYYAFDQIRLIPAYAPPLKKQPLASFDQRLAMLHLAFKDTPNIIIDDREKFFPQPSYTINTLLTLHRELTSTRFVIILGIDAFSRFNLWQRYLDILTLSHLMIIPRVNYQLADETVALQLLKEYQISSFDKFFEALSGKILLTSEAPTGISSTEIRELLNNQQAVGEFLPQSVYTYIAQHNLYMKK
jgi:nicotinate-nucleotide adenylyltransferase